MAVRSAFEPVGVRALLRLAGPHPRIRRLPPPVLGRRVPRVGGGVAADEAPPIPPPPPPTRRAGPPPPSSQPPPGPSPKSPCHRALPLRSNRRPSCPWRRQKLSQRLTWVSWRRATLTHGTAASRFSLAHARLGRSSGPVAAGFGPQTKALASTALAKMPILEGGQRRGGAYMDMAGGASLAYGSIPSHPGQLSGNRGPQKSRPQLLAPATADSSAVARAVEQQGQ